MRFCFLCKATLKREEFWQSVCHECAVKLPDDGDHRGLWEDNDELPSVSGGGTSVEDRVGPPSGTAGDVQTSDGDQCPVARSCSSTDVPVDK